MGAWEEVWVVKNPPTSRGNPGKGGKKNVTNKAKAARYYQKAAGPPSGSHYWRKQYKHPTSGKTVSGMWVKRGKNPGKKSGGKKGGSKPRKSNPGKSTRSRKKSSSAKKNPSPRKRKRNQPSALAIGQGHGATMDAPYKGKWDMAKTFGQASAGELVGTFAGIIVASLGPKWIQRVIFQDNWDITTGWRDPASTAVLALGGGMLLGRFVDKRIGRSFAVIGLTVAAIKAVRMLTQNNTNPMFPEGQLLGEGNLMGDAMSSLGLGYDAGEGGGMYQGGGGGGGYQYGTTYGTGTERVGLFEIQD